MTDEKLDSDTNDLYYDSTACDQGTTAGLDQVKQYLKFRLRLIMGELFDNVRLGLDYVNTIFQTKDSRLIDALIKSTIVGTAEVTGLISYSSTFNRTNRSGSASFTISTVYGNTTLTSVELLP